MDASTGEEWSAQEREIAEGEWVVASLVDDLFDDFCRERGEGGRIVLRSRRKGVHGSRKRENGSSESGEGGTQRVRVRDLKLEELEGRVRTW